MQAFDATLWPERHCDLELSALTPRGVRLTTNPLGSLAVARAQPTKTARSESVGCAALRPWNDRPSGAAYSPSAEMISPPARLPTAHQTGRLTEFLVPRTVPSRNRTFTTPG